MAVMTIEIAKTKINSSSLFNVNPNDLSRDRIGLSFAKATAGREATRKVTKIAAKRKLSRRIAGNVLTDGVLDAKPDGFPLSGAELLPVIGEAVSDVDLSVVDDEEDFGAACVRVFCCCHKIPRSRNADKMSKLQMPIVPLEMVDKSHSEPP